MVSWRIIRRSRRAPSNRGRAAFPSVLLVAASSAVFAAPVFAVDDVGGTLITLTSTPTAPNGAWSWFEDERAIIDDCDPDNTLLLVGSVSSAPNGDQESGDVDLLWLNIDSGQQGEFELSDRFQRDDHDSAALLMRPDGRYVAMYARHGSDHFSRWRVSTNPHDPTSWSVEQTMDNGAGTTYSNLHYLPSDDGGAGRTYDFSRATNFDPIILTSGDNGSTWPGGGKLLTQGGGSDRPYVRYFSDGQKIHFITTEEHPRNYDNSIYHGYIRDGVLYNSTGAVKDADLFDATAVAPASLTTVFSTGTSFGGTEMRRAWTIDVAIDGDGRPVAIFTARANDSDLDHRFFYARFDGASWSTHELAKAGGFLYNSENDYTGLAAIDPDDPSTVFISTKIDPRTNVAMTHYEIFRGATSDSGAAWDWAPITFNSTVDNLRPLVPKWNESETALIWLRGTYTTYTSWNTEVVALTDIDPLDLVSVADLDGDNDVTLLDYSIYLSGLHVDLSELTAEEAHLMGDLNGDLVNNFVDSLIFRREYDLFNGAGAFAADLAAVPEPQSLWMLATAASALPWRKH